MSPGTLPPKRGRGGYHTYYAGTRPVLKRESRGRNGVFEKSERLKIEYTTAQICVFTCLKHPRSLPGSSVERISAPGSGNFFVLFGADHPSATSIARLGIKLSAFVRSVQAAARFHAVLNAGMPIEPKIVHDTFAHHAQHRPRHARGRASKLGRGIQHR